METYSKITPVYYYSKNDNGTYTLKSSNSSYENVQPNDIMVICTEDIYFYNDNREIAINTYYDIDEFEKESLAFNGILLIGDKSYGQKTGRNDLLDYYYELIYNNNILSINLGSDKSEHILLPDQRYVEATEKINSYGFILEGGTSSYEGRGLWGFDTNRNGEFSYKFSLKEKEDIFLCLEFEDIWSDSVGDRIFNIEIETNSQKIIVQSIDLYAIGENDIVRLMIPLKEVDEIMCSLTCEKGGVPFCNVARILRQ